jgi:hypothetical protein
MKNGVFWDVTPCGSCKNDVSAELSASFMRVTRTGELGTTLAVASNRRTLQNSGKIIVLRNLILTFLDRRREDKKLWTEWQQILT